MNDKVLLYGDDALSHRSSQAHTVIASTSHFTFLFIKKSLPSQRLPILHLNGCHTALVETFPILFIVSRAALKAISSCHSPTRNRIQNELSKLSWNVLFSLSKKVACLPTRRNPMIKYKLKRTDKQTKYTKKKRKTARCTNTNAIP